MTLVAVVGPDGTGKTTLVAELAQRLGLEPVRFTQHSRAPDYLEHLEQPFLNEVWDRFFFDEYVYGPIVRPGEPYRWSEKERLEMTRLFIAQKPLVIFATRIVRPDDEYVTPEQNLRVAMAYGDMLAKFPCPVLEYRAGITTYESVEEAIRHHAGIHSRRRRPVQPGTPAVPAESLCAPFRPTSG